MGFEGIKKLLSERVKNTLRAVRTLTGGLTVLKSAVVVCTCDDI